MLQKDNKIARRNVLRFGENAKTRRQNTVSRHQPLRGFTLIELLVVIAIIALLVSILLPSLQKAKELAKATICTTNLSGISKGILYYADDYNGIVPPSWDGTNGDVGVVTWAYHMRKYLPGIEADPLCGKVDRYTPDDGPSKDRTIMHCPSEPPHGGMVKRDGYWYWVGGFVREDYALNAVRSCNAYTVESGDADNTGGWTSIETLLVDRRDSFEQSHIGSASDTFVLAEGIHWSIAPSHEFARDEYGQYSRFEYRHGKDDVANMLFFDGHVSPRPFPINVNGAEIGDGLHRMPQQAPW